MTVNLGEQAAQLDRIEAKLDWLHCYLTWHLRSHPKDMPPWPEGKPDGV